MNTLTATNSQTVAELQPEVKWRGPDSELSLRYQRAYEFELGTMYVANKHVLYLVRPEHEELFDNGLLRIHGLDYASDKQRHQFSQRFPSPVFVSKSKTVLALLLRKTEDVLPMREVLTHLGGQFGVRDVTWMLTCLHNIAAYFEYTKICHRALSIDTLFVSTSQKEVFVFGGWWYATPTGERPLVVAESKLNAGLVTEEVASLQTDQYLLKEIGRELRGHIPVPNIVLEKYLQDPPCESSIRAYCVWMNVISAGLLGPPSTLDVTAADIFKIKIKTTTQE